MELTLVRSNAAEVAVDALIVPEWEGARNQRLADTLAPYYDSGEISGKLLEFTLLHGVQGFAARRVLIAGAGRQAKFDPGALGRLTAAAVRFLKGKGVRTVALDLSLAGLSTPANVAAAAQAGWVGNWEPDHLKTSKEENKDIRSLALAVTGDAGLEEALNRGSILGEACNLTREISVEPPNLLTPLALAERARRAAGAGGISIDVLDRDRMRQLGMGALLGVAQGSEAPPALIVIQYRPENAGAGDGAAHLGFVGKGVTFDTGGISIKPSEGMDKMKYDMAGGAAVIGAMYAIARLKPPVAVTGLIPAVENMPGGGAQRPGDIIRSYSGKTVEILNTDAEGRLILADAITYAKQLGCTHLVDAATLTGAIVVALGHTPSGVFTNNEYLLAKWMAAAAESGERMWHMPLYDEYRDQLKSVYADIQNIGTRWGGACTAAMFLKEFVGDTPWIHVDVAGTAWLDDAKPEMPKGPTAVPLGTFVQLALNWNS